MTEIESYTTHLYIIYIIDLYIMCLFTF